MNRRDRPFFRGLGGAIRAHWPYLLAPAFFPFVFVSGFRLPAPIFGVLFVAVFVLGCWPAIRGQAPHAFKLVATGIFLAGTYLAVFVSSALGRGSP